MNICFFVTACLTFIWLCIVLPHSITARLAGTAGGHLVQSRLPRTASFEHLQGWSLHHLSGQPMPVFTSFLKEVSPFIHLSSPPLYPRLLGQYCPLSFATVPACWGSSSSGWTWSSTPTCREAAIKQPGNDILATLQSTFHCFGYEKDL